MSGKGILLCAAGAAAGAAVYGAAGRKKAMHTDGTGKTVLITGASGGIGKELAFIFAEHHFDLVLVARNEEKLREVQIELENSFGVSVTVIPKDLTDGKAPRELYDEISSRGLVIDQLVNNAGAGRVGTVTDTDASVMENLIQMNVTAVTVLCRLFGQDMVRRRSGKIMNVASIVAFTPDPYFNVYGPSKSYVLALTEAMRGELKGTGVTVTALCPGPTKTNWCASAGKKDSVNAVSAEKVAKAGFAGMQEGKLVVIPAADCVAYRIFMPLLPAALQTEIVALWQKSLIRA